MRSTFLATSAVVCAAALIACSETPEPEYPEGGYGAQNGQGAYGAQYGQGAYGAQAGQGAYGAGGQGAAGHGTAGQGGTAPVSTQATAIPAVMVPLAGEVLRGTAQQQTAGMTEDGPAIAAQFQQGQVFEQSFQLQPGRCYTVVGVGLGITELDVEIVVHQPPAPEWLAATDQMTGPHAIVGGGNNCFKNPLPVGGPAKVRLKATGGAGVAMAQIYSK